MVNHICEPISSNQFASCSSARVGQGGGGAPLTFEEVVLRVPALYNQLLASLARRLAETTARKTSSAPIAAARTITLVPAGQDGIPAQFFDRVRATFADLGKCLFLRYADIKERFPNLSLDNASIVNWL